MYYGKIVELASSDELYQCPIHPYTKSLLSAIPLPDPDYERKRVREIYDPSKHGYDPDEKLELREITPCSVLFFVRKRNTTSTKNNTKETAGLHKKSDKLTFAALF